jgi:Cu(I)/Ag(I) efflux system membrane protein CusA/SilA
VLRQVLQHPKKTLGFAVLACTISLWPISQIGSEFMPSLDEGDLMYMPTTYPAISIGKARELLQQTDKLIRTVPEVKTVFGKIGRADTATDPAPLTMIETYIQFHPQSEWRPGLSKDDLRAELDRVVQLPGVTNNWVMPIKTRIDMLATGIKTPVGIKVSGPDLQTIQDIGQRLETLLQDLPGTTSVYSERVAGGRYLSIDIQREQAARYGLNIADIQQIISTAIGGMNIGQTVEGRERYPINLRYPQAYRDSPEQIALLPIITPDGQYIALGDVATIAIESGPPGIKSENARINGWTYIDVNNVDVGSYVASAQQRLKDQLTLPAGYALTWAGQYEYMARAKAKLSYVAPLTLAIIVVLLYLNFRRMTEVAIILASLPLALVGSVWLMYLLGYNFSVASGVGFIALAGVAIEIGVLMLVYLNQAWRGADNTDISDEDLKSLIIRGAGLRVRPIIMTAGATIAGLLPILSSSGTGSEIMNRLAAPMVGGMISAVILTLLVIPAIFYLWRKSALN